MTTYNHMYTVAFSLETTHEPDDVTADELREALAERMRDLRFGAEIVEACGYPCDTYVVDREAA